MKVGQRQNLGNAGDMVAPLSVPAEQRPALPRSAGGGLTARTELLSMQWCSINNCSG